MSAPERMFAKRLDELPVMKDTVLEIAEITFLPGAFAIEYTNGDVERSVHLSDLVSKTDTSKPTKHLAYVLGTAKFDKDRFAFRIGVGEDGANIIDNYLVSEKSGVIRYQVQTKSWF